MQLYEKYRAAVMLLEFRIKNFRSFKNETILSLVASSDRTLKETNVTPTGIRPLPGVVNTAGIYGANASGKSNLVRAMQLLRGIVADSATLKPEQTFNVQPFRLDSVSKNEPCEFEISFITKSVRYQYAFSVTAQRVVYEKLVAYRTAKPQLWFERIFNVDTNRHEYTFGPNLLGQKNTWESATKENSLFLSTAVQLNSEQLRDVFDWITKIVVIENGGVPSTDLTISYIKGNSKREINNFLIEADFGISDVEIESQKGFKQSFNIDIATGKIENSRQEADIFVPIFSHRGKDVLEKFGLGDESEGTRKIFALAGPLFDIIKAGRLIVIDELDRSLHTLLVQRLIGMFQNPNINSAGAQLIFTTHDTALLSSELFRRDQVWFTEKNSRQESTLYPLTEFAPRKHEALERGYLSGRYGAVPILESN